MRVTWNPYQPEDSLMQPTVGASIFNKLLVAAPFLVMASIGAKSRSATNQYDFVACSSKQDKEISAYAPVVSATEDSVSSPMSTDPNVARRLAFRWIEGAKVGLLQPLDPCSFDDTTRDGIKGEIVRANVSVAEVMNYAAEQDAENGKYDKAAKDAMVAADTLEVTKFFDFASLTTCTMVQRRSLSVIHNVAKKLSPDVRSQVVREVLAFRSNDDRLGQMAVNARQELLKHELRQGQDLASIEHTQKEVNGLEFRNMDNLALACKDLRKGLKYSTNEDVPSLYTDVRLGFVSQLDTDKRIAAIVKETKTRTL